MINSLIFKRNSKFRDIIMVFVIIIAFFSLIQDKKKTKTMGI